MTNVSVVLGISPNRCHAETLKQRRAVGWPARTNDPKHCHSERSEESIWSFATMGDGGALTGFFTSFRMTSGGAHQQRNEESIGAFAGVRRSGLFTSFRMTNGPESGALAEAFQT